MSDFFRFPSTPHLAWLGKHEPPREDKMLTPSQINELLSGEVKVEEKLDGANIGISVWDGKNIRIQNRGQYLTEPYIGQFSRLSFWLTKHASSLISKISPNLIVYGEWCAARHSLNYELLPDFFLMFDVFDKKEGRFWSAVKRDSFAREIGLAVVPTIATHQNPNLSELMTIVNKKNSQFRKGQPMEGIIIRKDSAEWCELRAKLVREDFTQCISEHWSKRTIEWNQIDYGSI
ncbi:RNA ligase family protein [Shewanella xiamenensis]|uniref:RNA ligase family protein n=1 Tax=Shewanella xiamenensis TaxID=332186 RepID=A0AAE4TPZ1_9GAMM|nr:RNA ligase family protein [Shewanella xiamenensis]MDV5392348.1 RNA ligase family protein [Shewanella xiamenensis]